MARNRGSVAVTASSPEDPAFRLFVGIVERAQIDLTMPSDSKSSLKPSEYERRTAAEFLLSLQRSACRRLVE